MLNWRGVFDMVYVSSLLFYDFEFVRCHQKKLGSAYVLDFNIC